MSHALNHRFKYPPISHDNKHAAFSAFLHVCWGLFQWPVIRRGLCDDNIDLGSFTSCLMWPVNISPDMGLSRRRFPFVQQPQSLWDRVANGLSETDVLPQTVYLSAWEKKSHTFLSWPYLPNGYPECPWLATQQETWAFAMFCWHRGKLVGMGIFEWQAQMGD